MFGSSHEVSLLGKRAWNPGRVHRLGGNGLCQIPPTLQGPLTIHHVVVWNSQILHPDMWGNLKRCVCGLRVIISICFQSATTMPAGWAHTASQIMDMYQQIYAKNVTYYRRDLTDFTHVSLSFHSLYNKPRFAADVSEFNLSLHHHYLLWYGRLKSWSKASSKYNLPLVRSFL